jgi:hypothetical protein
LLGNVPVNGLDEWDINKLGWFKFRQNWNGEDVDSGDHMETGHQIKQAFSASVEDCQDNRHTFKVRKDSNRDLSFSDYRSFVIQMLDVPIPTVRIFYTPLFFISGFNVI